MWLAHKQQILASVLKEEDFTEVELRTDHYYTGESVVQKPKRCPQVPAPSD